MKYTSSNEADVMKSMNFFYIIHTKSKRVKKVKENAVARLQEPH